MEENLKIVFKNAICSQNDELANKIWLKIITHDKRINRFKLISSFSIGLTSILVLIPVFKILANDFAQSGFYEYLSLAFSKEGLFSSYGKEFAFSLAESFPITSTLSSLSLIFLFFLSLYYITKQFTQSRVSNQLSF